MKLQCVGLPTGTTVDRYVIGTDRQAARRDVVRPASSRHFLQNYPNTDWSVILDGEA